MWWQVKSASMLLLSKIVNYLVELSYSEKHLSSGFFTADHCDPTQLTAVKVIVAVCVCVCVCVWVSECVCAEISSTSTTQNNELSDSVWRPSFIVCVSRKTVHLYS